MGYRYTPTYYSSFQDSVATICKNILPFSFKKQRLIASEKKLSKRQSDNLKWQQESFHEIVKLMGLHKEGILPECNVSVYKTQLLEKLIASKAAEMEQPVILRDKLLFLQELLYAKCITTEEYHASKRPLLQRLSNQGAEIEARDVIAGDPKQQQGGSSDEEWSVIDLRDEQNLINKENSSNSKAKLKAGSTAVKKHIKGAASALGFGGKSAQKQGKNKTEKSIFDRLDNADESTQPVVDPNISGRKNVRSQWGFDGFGKWKKGKNEDDETAPLPLSETSGWGNGGGYNKMDSPSKLVASPIGGGPDTKQIKRKLHSDGSASDFFIDKVLGDNIKKELARIQTELSATNPNIQFSNDQMEEISTKLPVDKNDLKKFFPKSWCDRYGDVVLDVVKKEFKEHVGEMESLKNISRDKKKQHSAKWTAFEEEDDISYHSNPFDTRQNHGTQSKKKMTGEKERSNRWTTFEDDDENSHPNVSLFPHQNTGSKGGHNNNPFLSPDHSGVESNGKFGGNQNNRVSISHDHNPFWDVDLGPNRLG